MSDTAKAAPASKAPVKPRPKRPARRPASKPRVGSVHEVKTKGVLIVTRPDGSQSQVDSVDGVARYVLDVPGAFKIATSERDAVTVEAV